MAIETTSQAQLVVPSAATASSITGSASAWANSSWVQLTASTSTAIIITGVVVFPGVTGIEFEIDIGSGAATSEVVIGTVRGSELNVSSGTPWYIPFVIPINNIATATRVSARVRKANTITTAWNVVLTYYGTGTLTGVTTTANASQIVPSAAGGTGITPSGVAWANSAYAQVIASTLSAIIISGITVVAGANGEFEIDIATGTATSEVVITTIRGFSLNQGGPGFIKLLNPLNNVAISTRVAVRLRIDTTSVTAWTIALTYYNKPL